MKKLAFMSITLAACVGNEPKPLVDVLHQRLDGDRTGACIAAAVLGTTTQREIVCAAPERAAALDTHSAFEIGSITKTMTGFLLASLIEQHALDLDDTLQAQLPRDTVVPSFGGAPIRLRHLVTHTAGLPPVPTRMAVVDPTDPYRALDVPSLLGSLADVTLTASPGSNWAYSNFGFLLLSYVVTQKAGSSYESLLNQRLFAPLGMSDSFIVDGGGRRVVQGHLPSAAPTAAWTFPVDLAGAGGVRASLDDMVHYAEAGLGRGDAGVVATLRSAMTRVELPGDVPAMGLAWLLPNVEGHQLYVHDGGTGGFSSFLLLEPAHDRAVVLLSDTALTDLGGLTTLALYLLDPGLADPPRPRRLRAPPAALVQGLVGRYTLGESIVELTAANGGLEASLDGERTALEYDSEGDFFSRSVDGLLTPVALAGGAYSFRYTRQGAVVMAERLP
jgi:serine-type D-Ala-D-Ala carboxypeptidase/endopeptidase